MQLPSTFKFKKNSKLGAKALHVLPYYNMSYIVYALDS